MRAADVRGATALDPAATSRDQANTRPFADCDELDGLLRSAGSTRPLSRQRDSDGYSFAAEAA